jgi:hypothetical protein
LGIAFFMSVPFPSGPWQARQYFTYTSFTVDVRSAANKTAGGTAAVASGPEISK